jgi:hypothetical protein
MERELHLFIGGLFSLTGLVLVGYGLLSDPSIYARSLGWNVNLWWGLVTTLFGASFLLLWRTSRPR